MCSIAFSAHVSDVTKGSSNPHVALKSEMGKKKIRKMKRRKFRIEKMLPARIGKKGGKKEENTTLEK